jgi:pimeloyl-ACP methyl ester carboxylesterase
MFWRFDSDSWSHTLTRAGFDVFGIDLLGYGASDRYPEMDGPADGPLCPGRAADASEQIAAAVDHIRALAGVERVHLVSHSWGTMAAALYATRRPETVERLVLFAPITARAETVAPSDRVPAWYLVSAEDQWSRFSGYCPAGEPPVFPRERFEPWAMAYLASDAGANRRRPPAVKVPGGPLADLLAARAGVLPYDPARLTCPTLIVRGEWDHWPTDEDARWLFAALRNSPIKRDAKIPRGTHVMHLETSRLALFEEVRVFLDAEGAGFSARRASPGW